MGRPVVVVASGGLAVTEASEGYGLPVMEAESGYGMPVTVVSAYGMPVVFLSGSPGGGGPEPEITYAAWDPATVSNVTLSGGNLVATNTGTTSSDQGARGLSTFTKTTGKYYFEITFTSYTGSVLRLMAGVGTSASTYAGMSSNGTSGAIGGVSGAVHANGAGTAIDFVPAGNLPVGGVIGIAVDLDNRKAWFRQAPSGNWNGSATANPATNAEGATVPTGGMIPFCTFGGTAGTAGNVTTANFGASAFVGAVPSGFTSGWQNITYPGSKLALVDGTSLLLLVNGTDHLLLAQEIVEDPGFLLDGVGGDPLTDDSLNPLVAA